MVLVTFKMLRLVFFTSTVPCLVLTTSFGLKENVSSSSGIFHNTPNTRLYAFVLKSTDNFGEMSDGGMVSRTALELLTHL